MPPAPEPHPALHEIRRDVVADALDYLGVATPAESARGLSASAVVEVIEGVARLTLDRVAAHYGDGLEAAVQRHGATIRAVVGDAVLGLVDRIVEKLRALPPA